jgi:hypothetical protein
LVNQKRLVLQGHANSRASAPPIELAGAIWQTLKDGDEFKVLSAAAMKEWERVA